MDEQYQNNQKKEPAESAADQTGDQTGDQQGGQANIGAGETLHGGAQAGSQAAEQTGALEGANQGGGYQPQALRKDAAVGHPSQELWDRVQNVGSYMSAITSSLRDIAAEMEKIQTLLRIL